MTICHDPRRPTPIEAPHGMHHWQVRIPLPRRSHLCLTLTSGRYFVPMVERTPGLLRVAVPFASAAVVKQAGNLSLTRMRWCAHIDVRETRGRDAATGIRTMLSRLDSLPESRRP